MFKFKKDIKNLDYVDINNFYMMLLKYKRKNPNFNLNKVIRKLYPGIDWNRLR